MNAIRNVFAAFANLAAAVNALASVIDTAAGRLRLQLADDSPPRLTHDSPTGEIVDCGANGAMQAEQPTAKRGKARAGAV